MEMSENIPLDSRPIMSLQLKQYDISTKDKWYRTEIRNKP